MNIGKLFLLASLLMPLATKSTSFETDGFIYYENIRWYQGPNELTASGEKFDVDALCYASKSDRIGTVSKVDWKGKTITVRCNDRGPNELELTRGAFAKLDNLDVGVLRNAKITIINTPKLK